MVACKRRCLVTLLGVCFFSSICLAGEIEPEGKWNRQAAADAQHDQTTLIFDGQSPNQLACDTTLRQLTDGSWVMVMLGGGDTEPLPQNQVFITRSQDQDLP